MHLPAEPRDISQRQRALATSRRHTLESPKMMLPKRGFDTRSMQNASYAEVPPELGGEGCPEGGGRGEAERKKSGRPMERGTEEPEKIENGRDRKEPRTGGLHTRARRGVHGRARAEF